MNILKSLFRNSNTIEIVYELFRHLDVEVTKSTLEEHLINHPDYPSLLSISDILSYFEIKNESIKISVEQLQQVPTPCIAPMQTDRNGQGFTIIKSVYDGNVCYFDPGSHRYECISINIFQSKWTSGILTLIDAEHVRRESMYLKKKREEWKNASFKYVSYFAIPIFVFLSCVSVIYQFGASAVLPVIYTFLTLAGLLVSGTLVWYELDKSNTALQQICRAGAKTNCNAVLSSGAAEILGMKWSSIGFVYYLGGVLFLIIKGILDAEALYIMGWLSIAAMPYIIFSVYYQLRVERQWCVLCLIVQAILAVQGVIVLFSGWTFEIPFASVMHVETLTQFGISYLVPAIILSIVLPIFREALIGRQRQVELKKLKYDPEVFQTLLAKRTVITESTSNLGITVGNPNATHKIIKVCNPYCTPCAKAHVPIEALLASNPDVQVQIIFTGFRDLDDPTVTPIAHFLAIKERYGEETAKQALDKWYFAPEKNYEEFAAQYPIEDDLNKQSDKLKAMKHWCRKTNILFTPTFFVNGHLLPELYGANDLRYFLSI